MVDQLPQPNATAIIPTAPSHSSTILNISPPFKLTSTNYLLWKTQLIPLLCVYDLLPHVDGTIPAPFAMFDRYPNLAYLDWLKRDQLVLS